MNIHNISNQQLANITTCESEPIHIPGSIQPHGFLIGVNPLYDIIYCSANCDQFLSAPVSDVLGKPLTSFFKPDEVEALKVYYQLKDSEKTTIRPFVFSFGDKAWHVTTYQTQQAIVMECELVVEQARELPDLYFQSVRFAYRTGTTDNLRDLCQNIAEETRAITGFDRVMIYKFNKDHDGEVIAESKIDSLEPFLGLHYPQSDIPKQARELYLRSYIRMIVDVTYTPVPIFGLSEGNSLPPLDLDLSLSFLRSVSPIHIQYLKNMGVSSSFSISLIYKSQLWGLISCHHTTPHHIPFHARMAAQLQGIFLSSQIAVREAADEFERHGAIEQKLHDIENSIKENGPNFFTTEGLRLLRTTIHADGIIVSFRRKVFSDGPLPEETNLISLLTWLESRSEETPFITSRLIDYFPQFEALTDRAAGIIYHAFEPGSGNFILWTRKEMEKIIPWAGDRRKEPDSTTLPATLSPRQSFDIWMESVKFQSEEWNKSQLNVASSIVAIIQRQLHRQHLKAEEIRYGSLSEKLEKAKEEIANMNWASTHDLKEPIRKIQMYASLILEKQSGLIPESTRVAITNMQASAVHMRLLIDDLIAYSKIINEQEHMSDVDLTTTMREVEDLLHDKLLKTNSTISVPKLPIITGMEGQLRQLFFHIINNALKFARKEVPLHINISVDNNNTFTFVDVANKTSFHKIIISDNGIGFNVIYKDEIFKVLRRLHNKTSYPGSGIGLAICKKIMERHKGYIDADGIEGKGANFILYFPKRAD